MAEDGIGLSIIDVDPPGSAGVINSIGLGDANGVCVDDGYAYVAAVSSGLYIIDVDPPESAYIIANIATASANGVTVEDGHAYLATAVGLQIVDVDPPESAWIEVHVGVVYWWTPYDVTVQNGYAYMASSAGDAGKLIVFDVDPVADASVLAMLDIPNVAYGVAVEGDKCYVAAGASGLRIFDLW